jgi:protein subunit release factor A
MATNGDNDRETTEHMIEGTREAKEAAQESVEEVHEEADDLEDRLEAEGLTPSDDTDEE